MQRPAHASGFTLLEVLIALSLFLVALAAVAVALDSNRVSYLRGERKMDVQQNARLAMGEIVGGVRMGGYFPENFASPAADPPLSHPVHLATDAALALHGDLDGSGASSVFLYCLDGSVLRRGRGAAGDAAAYWCPAGEPLAEGVTRLRFDYFDSDNLPLPDPPGASFQLDGQAPGAVPDFDDVAERGAVRRVVVTLTVTQQAPGLGSQAYTMSSEVRLRNAG